MAKTVKHLLSVNRANSGKFFIMNNTCQSDGRAYGMIITAGFFDDMKSATIAMFRLKSDYTNIYDMSESAYNKHIRS